MVVQTIFKTYIYSQIKVKVIQKYLLELEKCHKYQNHIASDILCQQAYFYQKAKPKTHKVWQQINVHTNCDKIVKKNKIIKSETEIIYWWSWDAFSSWGCFKNKIKMEFYEAFLKSFEGFPMLK